VLVNFSINAMKKIIRTLTVNYCVPAHLDNTLKRIPDDVKLFIIGDKVTEYAQKYPKAIFIDLPIRRNFSLIFDLYVLLKLIKYFKTIKPDIVHSLMTKSGLITAIASKIAGVKIRLHTFTGQIWSNKKGITKMLLRLIDKVICFFNTDCLTDSPSQSDYLYINGVKINGKPLKCLSKGSLSGVDLNRFNIEKLLHSKKELKLKLNLNESDFILAYIARKSFDKGCMEMLKIFVKIKKLYPQIKLLYIGPDESKGAIQNFYLSNPEIKNNIIDIGFVHDHENYLAVCNILCLPSFREGFGSIVIDAAALKVPTIGYRIPGLIDSIADGCSGILVDINDMDQFVNKIDFFIKSPDILIQYGNNARKYIEEYFDADLINSELYSIYNKYLEAI
jgi:glycosyltransferase involved in cell wall biosynthesis